MSESIKRLLATASTTKVFSQMRDSTSAQESANTAFEPQAKHLSRSDEQEKAFWFGDLFMHSISNNEKIPPAAADVSSTMDE